MRHILTSVFLIVLLFPALALGGKTIKVEDLVLRNGLFFKKFSDVPFTGKITGKVQGSFKEGKQDGPWVYYHENGQLWKIVTYKDGKKDGSWVSYWDNGQLWSKGTRKDGMLVGPWVYYFENGVLWIK